MVVKLREKNNKHYVDLSDIKEDDLDKTASFTDLMSRSEKKKRERIKEEEKTRELKEILMNDDDNKNKKQKKKKELDETLKINKEKIKEEQEIKKENEIKNLENLSKTQRFLDLTTEIKTSMLNNVDDNLDLPSKKKFGIGNILIMDLFIILSLAYYIYSILFTDIQNNQLYLLIGGIFIISMITIFCISIISNRILYKIFSILNYLIFISYIAFNLILVLGIIKL